MAPHNGTEPTRGTSPRQAFPTAQTSGSSRPGLSPPEFSPHIGDAVDMRFMRNTVAPIVGRIVSIDQRQIAIEDFAGRRWTTNRSDVVLRPADPSALRRYMTRQLESSRRCIETRLRSEIDSAEPLRDARPDERPGPVFDVVETPIGAKVWPYRRTPRASQRKLWRNLETERERLETQLDLLQVPPHHVPAGKPIPSRGQIDNLLALAARGLIADHELNAIATWLQFWADHPSADSGVMGVDRVIHPTRHRGLPLDPQRPRQR